MFEYIKSKIKKSKQRRTFEEYGTSIDTFQISPFGEVLFAQWLHPFDKPKEITVKNIELYKKLAKSGSMIIDIGAHTGDTTVPMGLAVGKKGVVLGIEPNKYVFKVLEENAKLNPKITNIIPYCFAATENKGVFTFNYSDASFCNGGFVSQIKTNNHHLNYELEVEGKNLQDFLFENHAKDLPRLDLLKVDAEGYDKEILKTIPKILQDFKPNLMIECYKKLTREERQELYDVVDSFGYLLYYMEDFEDEGKKVEVLRDHMMERSHFDMVAIHQSK